MRAVFYTHGICLVGLSLFLLIPAILEVGLHTNDWAVFVLTSFFCMFAGGGLMLANRGHQVEMGIRHVYLMTATLWLVLPVVSGLPYYFTSTAYHLDFTDSVFEAVSGMSTTGSTVYTGLDSAPKGILLWRSLTVWIGGMGIIVLTMSILPFLRVGGMQLFKTESSDNAEKVLPKTSQLAAATTLSYIALSAIGALGLYLAGMTGFDAINHAMCAMGTGGLSTHDASFMYFKSPAVEWVGILVMMFGATPMLLWYSLVTRHSSNRILMHQSKVFWAEIALVTLAVAVYIYFTIDDMQFKDAIRLTAFNIVSVGTTTGFASADYNQWGPFAIIVFYFLTVIGGCTGSTSGGIKTFRIIVMAKALIYETKKLVRPNGVFSVKIAKTTISEGIMKSVGLFLIIYILVFVVIAICLAASGLDMITSLSGSATALAGVGPGLGPIIGPTGNFSTLTDFAKWSLVVAMIAGRLEIMTLLVLLSKNYWQDFK